MAEWTWSWHPDVHTAVRMVILARQKVGRGEDIDRSDVSMIRAFAQEVLDVCRKV
jgi:hypothetical protein